MMDIKTVCRKVFKKRSRADYLRIIYGRLGFTYFIDHTFYGKYSAIIEGWIASKTGEDCVIRVYDAANEKIRASVTRYSRNIILAGLFGTIRKRTSALRMPVWTVSVQN